jgi:hypothetical protein
LEASLTTRLDLDSAASDGPAACATHASPLGGETRALPEAGRAWSSSSPASFRVLEVQELLGPRRQARDAQSLDPTGHSQWVDDPGVQAGSEAGGGLCRPASADSTPGRLSCEVLSASAMRVSSCSCRPLRARLSHRGHSSSQGRMT